MAVSSKALFTGIDTTDPTAPIDEIFHTFKNHATATASLLEYYSRQSNFHPKQHGLYTSEDDFAIFLSKFISLRAFDFKRSEYEIELEGGLGQLKEAIAASYIPPSGNADEAASAFVNQIPQSADPHLYGTWNLVLITLHGGVDYNITLDIAILDLTIVVNAAGLVWVPAQYAVFSRYTNQVNSQYLLEDSTPLLDQLSVVRVKTFEDIFTTRK